MRTLLAIVIFAGGIFALDSTADAARKSKGSAKAHSSQQKASQQKVDIVCEERARHEDPAGQFKHYPCWAREAFGRGSNINLN